MNVKNENRTRKKYCKKRFGLIFFYFALVTVPSSPIYTPRVLNLLLVFGPFFLVVPRLLLLYAIFIVTEKNRSQN